jgi:hypothetical protein
MHAMSASTTHRCPLLDALLDFYNVNGYPAASDHVLFTFILDSGEVIRGDVIGLDEFNSLNSQAGGGHFSNSFTYTPSSEADVVYLSEAEILSNGQWVALGNAELGRGILRCCSDRGFRP